MQSYRRYLYAHLLLLLTLVFLGVTSACGLGPLVPGDSGLKGHWFWFAGAIVFTIIGPVAAWCAARRVDPVFASFCLVLLATLLAQIAAEIVFISSFWKNIVNPVAIGFILLRCIMLNTAIARFRGGPLWERVFLATNFAFWAINGAQQLILSTPHVLGTGAS
jgi:hypothetical protein